MLRMSDLETHPAVLESALPPGVHVCPWGTGDGRVEMTLVGYSRRRLATVFSLPDTESMERAREELLAMWNGLEPQPFRPHLKVIA